MTAWSGSGLLTKHLLANLDIGFGVEVAPRSLVNDDWKNDDWLKLHALVDSTLVNKQSDFLEFFERLLSVS